VYFDVFFNFQGYGVSTFIKRKPIYDLMNGIYGNTYHLTWKRQVREVNPMHMNDMSTL